MLKKVGLGILAVIGLLVVGVVAWWYLVVKPETARVIDMKPKNLNQEAVKAGLKSKVFREKLEAKRQIEKLTEAERSEVFLDLAQDPDSAARMMACGELAKLKGEAPTQALLSASASDADAEVRATALSALVAVAYPKAAAHLFERLQKDTAESAQRAAAKGLDQLQKAEISKPYLEKDEGWNEARPKLIEEWKARLGVK